MHLDLSTLSSFQLFLHNFGLIRGHTLLPRYPLHERHQLRGRGVELNAIDCSRTDLILAHRSKLQIERQLELRLVSRASWSIAPRPIQDEDYTSKEACDLLHCAHVSLTIAMVVG